MTFTRLRTGNFLSGSVASGTLGPGAITGFPAAASASDDDLVLIYDDDAAALRKMTRANFTSGITGDITAVTAGTGLTGGGDTGDVTLDINDSVVATISGSNFTGNVGVTGSIQSTLGYSGSLTNLLDGTSYLAAGAGISIASSSNGQIIITNDGTVGDITSVTAGTGLSGGGATGDITLSINDSIVATISGTNFAGNVGVTGSFAATTGISGSLTQLVGGESYLIAGDNVTITSESNGSVTISSTATATPGGSDTQVQFNDGGSFGGDAGLVFNKTTNSLYAQGVITGSLGLTGSLTRLVDGTSYLVAGANVSITSESNGQVAISSTDTNTEYTAGTGLKLDSTEFSINDSVVATLSGSKFSGDVAIEGNLYLSGNVSDFTVTGSAKFNSGLSGSLTRLVDGTSYLAAGSNVTITSASNGQVSIAAATGLTEISQDTSPELGGQLVTGDHKIAFGTGNNTSEIDFTYNGGGNFTAIASVKSIDMFLDLNGGDAGQQFRIFNNLQPASSYAGGTNTDVNAIFRVREEGNVFTKGYITSSMGFSGSLTRLIDGTSYLAAGSNVTITSASNGQVTISSTGGGTPGGSDTQVQFNDGGSFGGDAGLLYNKTSNSLYAQGVVTGALGFSGSLTRLVDGTSYLAAGANVTITSASNGQVTVASIDTNTEYTAGTGLILDSTEFSINDSVVATISGSNFAGNIGVTGSLHVGSSATNVPTSRALNVYANVSSDYAAHIDNDQSSAGHGLKVTSDGTGSGTNLFDVESASTTVFRIRGDARVGIGKVTSLPAAKLTVSSSNTDSDIAIAHKIHHIGDDDTNITFDTNKITLGAGGSKNLSIDSTDGVLVTGSVRSTLGYSGSLTNLLDGTSYLAAGANVTITSASNGQVTISSTAPGTPGGSDTQLQFNDGGSFGGISGATTDGSAVTFGDSGILVGQDITHAGDADTKIVFADDAIGITVGGEQLLTISEAGTDMVTVGDGGDVDFRVRTNNDDNTLYIEGSTDRIGVGTNSPTSILHIKEAAPTLTLQRENNSNASTINFIGASANTANSIIHDSSTNDLVFKTFNGSAVEEILRIGDHYGVSNRQVIILSGTTMHGGAMHPRNTPDIAFFVSGAIGSKNTAVKGAAVFGGDTVVSGGLFTSDARVKSPTRHVLQSTGSIMTLTSEMNFFSVDSAAEQSGIIVNTYDMGVTNGEYDGQEVTIMYTGSLNPTSGTYALWSSTVNYVKQVRVGAAGSNAIITLSFQTADPSVINGKTLNLIDTLGAVYSFTGSSSTSPASPSYSAPDKSVTYGVNGISTTDDAASALSNGVFLAISNGALFNTPTVFSDGSGRIQIQQSAVGSSGNNSIAGTALSAATIVDTGGTNAFVGGANNPNAANVNYGDSNESQAMAYLNWKSPTLKMVWDAETGKWNVITKNDTTI